MLMIEISPPFQWKPTIFRGKTGMISRVMWGWFAVAYTPMDFNEFIEQTAQAALHREKMADYEAALVLVHSETIKNVCGWYPEIEAFRKLLGKASDHKM